MFSQTTITGTIKDLSLGGPLPGANVKVLQKSIGTITDFDGNFSLQYTENLSLIHI